MIDQQGLFSKTGKQGFTLVRKPGTKAKASPFSNLKPSSKSYEQGKQR